MSKKEVLKRYFIFLIGIYINSFGISFITKAALGTSPISSVPYVLSLGFWPTMGEFTIALSLLLILLQIALLGKKFKKASLLQIPVSIVFGYFIDWSMLLLEWVNPQEYLMKILFLLIGCVILGFGVFLEVAADVVMLPGEAFVQAVTIRFRTDFGITKVCFDASMAGSALVISLILFHGVIGVREGTIVAALTVGLIAKLFGKALKKPTAKLLPAQVREAVPEYEETGTPHRIITIGREFGSGGREVGKLVAEKLGLAEKPDFIAQRRDIVHVRELPLPERQALVERDPAYGNILCRCEQISEGEIRDAIRRSPGARSLDGVKRRVRAGMGRCQGGFCAPRVMELLSEELGVPQTQLTKSGGGSLLLTGETKEVQA